MHLHTLHRSYGETAVSCTGCDVDLRLASYDEAVYVHSVGIDNFDGEVLLFINNVIVVPRDFRLFQEA